MQPNATLVEQELGMSLPHRRMEAWKWTDVRKNLPENKMGLSSACAPILVLPDGVSVRREGKAAHGGPMAALAAKFAGDVYCIDIPAETQVDTPIEISGMAAGHTRINIKVGKNSSLNLAETYVSNTAIFANTEICFTLEQGASLTRTVYHNDHAGTVRSVISHISAWSGVSVRQHALSFGAGLTRLETRIASLGENLKAMINGAYLLSGKRHCDMTSYIDLGAPSALIGKSVKGVVTDKARGVFQGKFHVRRPAQLTDAQMRHDAIMLSDACEIRSKPELEIYADDVACAHGNTVGALDESALFYMRQRGIPARQARALLTQAFVASAFGDMDDSAGFMAQISDWLEQNS